MKARQLGSVRIDKVVEFDAMPSPAQAVFPELRAADLAALRRWLDDPLLSDDPATARVALSMHSFVLRTGARTVLIDACNGNHKPRPLIGIVDRLERPDYLNNLAALGLRPEDIDLVMCTHLHFDHVGWNTQLRDGRWVPTFPNARYLFSRKDYEHFANTRESDPVHGPAFDDSVLPVMLAGQGELVEQTHRFALDADAAVVFEPASGHSAGSVLIHVRSGGEAAVFSGDVVHHPVQLVRPELYLALADADIELARRTRLRFLEECARTGALLCPAHFVEPTVGQVVRDGTAYRMEFAT